MTWSSFLRDGSRSSARVRASGDDDRVHARARRRHPDGLAHHGSRTLSGKPRWGSGSAHFGAQSSAAMANIARVAVLALTGAMALRRMGLANEIIQLAFGLLLGGLGLPSLSRSASVDVRPLRIISRTSARAVCS
jgi:hypothetical protein